MAVWGAEIKPVQQSVRLRKGSTEAKRQQERRSHPDHVLSHVWHCGSWNCSPKSFSEHGKNNHHTHITNFLKLFSFPERRPWRVGSFFLSLSSHTDEFQWNYGFSSFAHPISPPEKTGKSIFTRHFCCDPYRGIKRAEANSAWTAALTHDFIHLCAVCTQECLWH